MTDTGVRVTLGALGGEVPQVIDHQEATGRSWWWLVLVAVVVLAVVWWRVASARRDRWPTADYTMGVLERTASWFRRAYLRW